jgi:hypothetical protein
MKNPYNALVALWGLTTLGLVALHVCLLGW